MSREIPRSMNATSPTDIEEPSYFADSQLRPHRWNDVISASDYRKRRYGPLFDHFDASTISCEVSMSSTDQFIDLEYTLHAVCERFIDIIIPFSMVLWHGSTAAVRIPYYRTQLQLYIEVTCIATISKLSSTKR